ncbi:unnamed protein product [Protopolystoma xenopodis]|uniref:Uncharacterized protein n=1 Tax=Protopolystoma xenopodis TaxID=117903 RepID=A0A448WAZ6_9PLAT|nr:unnamed protein product [Protopolystoma xenopodis]
MTCICSASFCACASEASQSLQSDFPDTHLQTDSQAVSSIGCHLYAQRQSSSGGQIRPYRRRRFAPLLPSGPLLEVEPVPLSPLLWSSQAGLSSCHFDPSDLVPVTEAAPIMVTGETETISPDSSKTFGFVGALARHKPAPSDRLLTGVGQSNLSAHLGKVKVILRVMGPSACKGGGQKLPLATRAVENSSGLLLSGPFIRASSGSGNSNNLGGIATNVTDERSSKPAGPNLPAQTLYPPPPTSASLQASSPGPTSTLTPTYVATTGHGALSPGEVGANCLYVDQTRQQVTLVEPVDGVPSHRRTVPKLFAMDAIFMEEDDLFHLVGVKVNDTVWLPSEDFIPRQHFCT